MAKLMFLTIMVVAMVTSVAWALPVTHNKKDEKEQASSTPATPDVEMALEYERYLKEVVEALESDPEFRKKLDKAPEADIRNGKIAEELDFVSHHIRTKLDEIKRRELDRLRMLANKEYELRNEIDRDHLKVPQHVDHNNVDTFEIEDLRKLILKTSEDLAEADRKRRSEFKEYEMQKEFERETKMKEMNEEERKKFEQQIKEEQEKHRKHEKVHHPGNKAQLEEVWEKTDHMDKQDFDPRAFFMIHDVDSNGYWDETEVKALFIKELDKVYQSGLPEDDMRERAEEMERMREHVFQEVDANRDGLISFNEFYEQTKREDFNRDPGWETLDEKPQYTHEEYLQFERQRQEEIQRLIAQGALPPHPNMPHGYYPNGPHDTYQQQGQYHQQQQVYQQGVPQQQQQYHQQGVPQQQQYHQQGIPQQYQYQQVPQQGQPVHLNPNQQYQVVQQQVPVQQQQQQVPVQQQQQQVPVQQQQHQVPVQQQQQQVPVQQQQHQVPVQQQQQQVPVQQQQRQVPVQQQQQQVPVQQQQQQVPVQQQQQEQSIPVQHQQQQHQVPVQQQQQPIPVQQQQANLNQVPQQVPVVKH